MFLVGCVLPSVVRGPSSCAVRYLLPILIFQCTSRATCSEYHHPSIIKQLAVVPILCGCEFSFLFAEIIPHTPVVVLICMRRQPLRCLRSCVLHYDPPIHLLWHLPRPCSSNLPTRSWNDQPGPPGLSPRLHASGLRARARSTRGGGEGHAREGAASSRLILRGPEMKGPSLTRRAQVLPTRGGH